MKKLTEFYTWLNDEGKDTKTITAYQSVLNQFITWYEGTEENLILSDIKAIHIKEYQSYLKHNLNRKQATVNKHISALKTFFNFLIENGDIRDNPMNRIKIQKINQNQSLGKKSFSKWLSKQEQDRFMRYVETEKNDFQRIRNTAIVVLMLYTGLRVSDVTSLKLDDIKVLSDRIEITIRDGKRGQYNTVALVKKHSKPLIEWLKFRNTLPNSNLNESDFLFVSERSKKLSERGIQLMMKKYSELAQMDLVTPHRLRHSFCKNLALAGISIEVISKLARHENINTTAIYIDASYEEQLSALNKL